MNNPQFSNEDMDQDGILDLIIFDRSGYTWSAFRGEREGLNIRYSYFSEWETDLPKTDFFSLLVDYNGDGIKDIFTGSSVPGIPGMQVYKGKFENNKISYSLVVSSKGQFPIIYYENKSGSFNNLYVSTIDLPAILDVDGDKDIDILTFDPGGSTVYYYKNLSNEKGWDSDSLEYFFTDQCWGKFVESGLNSTINLSDNNSSCASGLYELDIRHAGATVSGFDLDVDNDIDLLIGDLSSDNISALFNGGSESDAFITAVDPTYPSLGIPVSMTTFPGVFFVDIDQDGKEDMIASPNESNFGENIEVAHFYRNTGDGGSNEFTLTNKRFLTEQIFDAGLNTKAAILDVDGDGLNDIVVGSSGPFVPFGGNDTRLILLKNIGSFGHPIFRLHNEDFLGMSAYSNTYQNLTPEAGDIDGDGDIDLLIGENLGKLIFFENIATGSSKPKFSAPILNYLNIDVGLKSSPCIFDLDKDGLNDLVIGERNGNLNYFRNIGSPGQELFDPELSNMNNSDFLGEIDVRKRGFATGASSPQIISRGDSTILIVGSQNSGILSFLVNSDLGGSYELINDFKDIREGDNVRPAVGDIDGDGYFELVLGNKRGGLTIRNTPWRTIITSIHESIGTEISLFPNPTNNYINWGNELNFGFVEVFTISGTKVPVRQERNSLFIGDLKTGIYIIKLSERASGKIYTSRFIKL
jgi:hypothetical protein